MSRLSRAHKAHRRLSRSVELESLELRRLFAGYTLEQSIAADAPDAFGNFGRALATNGNLALVAAPGSPDGVDPLNTSGNVYLVDTTNGQTLRTFSNPVPSEGGQFGAAVAWVGDKIAISAPETGLGLGRVYVYDDADDLLPTVIDSPYIPLGGPDPIFGTALAAYGDDLLVSASFTPAAGNNGQILRYDLDGLLPTVVQSYNNPAAVENDQLGSVIAVDGNDIYATSLIYDGLNFFPQGTVVKFDGESGAVLDTIVEPGAADNSHGFGSAIAVAGGNLLIGASGIGAVFQLDKSSLSEIRTYTLPAGETFGGLFSIAVSGNTAAFGNPFDMDGNDDDGYFQTGEVYVFDLATGDQTATLENPTPQLFFPDNGNADAFGSTIASLPDGGFLVADPFDDDNVSYDTGSVFAYASDEVEVPTNNAPTNAAIAGQSGAYRGQTISFSGSFSDPDAGDSHSVSWDFGDGNVIADHPTTDAGALTVSHAYQSTGTFTVTMTITDAADAVATATFLVNVTATSVQSGILYVGGSGGSDTVTITRTGSTNNVTIGGQTTPYTGSKVVIYGGNGNDVVLISENVTLTVEAHGGAGNDILTGGGGSSILVGDSGTDILTGGGGRDLLIGGTGSDLILGNADQDILIAGSTAFDNNSASLGSIIAVWNGSGTYTARVNNLRAGLLTPDQDVFDDGAIDILAGNQGTDWFLFNNDAGARDIVLDRASAEQYNDLDTLVT